MIIARIAADEYASHAVVADAASSSHATIVAAATPGSDVTFRCSTSMTKGGWPPTAVSTLLPRNVKAQVE